VSRAKYFQINFSRDLSKSWKMKSTRQRPSSQGRYEKKQRRGSYSLANPPSRMGTKFEKKNIDTDTPALIAVGSTLGSGPTLLNTCAQGTTAITRVGRSIRMTSIQYRFIGSLAATSVGSSPLRLLIVYDKQTNQAAPTCADIMQSDTIESPLNLEKNKRFVVLFDDDVECIGTAGPQSWSRKGYKKINLETEFTGASGTVGYIIGGAVWAIVYQNGNIITTAPAMQLYTRIRYIDA